MKHIFITIVTFFAVAATVASAQTVKLPAPDMNRQTSQFMETLQNRRSIRDFSEKELSQQDLSDLLWAAQGKSRKDGRMTSPTAMNRQEILVYVFTKDGVSLYNHDDHELIKVLDGDHRGLCAGSQAAVKKAPVFLLLVADFGKFGSKNDHAVMMVYADAGIVSENINLFCAATGLATVPRGVMDNAGLVKLLGLSDKQIPVLNNPVGFQK